MSNKKAKCLLCPHFCILLDGQVGKCHARINRDGVVVIKDFGAISSMAVEPIEKKPFKNFLPVTKTLSIGGWGCSLRCVYCENHKISQSEAPVNCNYFSLMDIVEMAIDKQCDSVCMTYNEPTLSFEYLMDLASLCHKKNLYFIIKTNAYINSDPWDDICKNVDAMNIDVKGIYSLFEKMTTCKYVNIYYHILSAMVLGSHVEVSIPVYGGVDMKGFLYHFCEEMKSLQLDIPCHLLKMTPAHLMIDAPMTSNEEVEVAKDILSGYFTNIYM
jgi:pyruvate formate lyase activating enzyme